MHYTHNTNFSAVDERVISVSKLTAHLNFFVYLNRAKMEVQSLLSFYQILIYLDNQWLPLLKDALTKWVAYTYHNVVRCPLCTRGDIAIMFCIDCDVPIDQECLEFHQSIKSYLEHNIIEIRTCKQKFQIKQFARKHTCACRKKPPAESFCNTCRCFICEKCVESHNIENHTIISLQDVYLILESIHELKLSLEENICTSPTIENEKLVLSKTAISWVEAVFGINTDFDDVCSVPVPSCLRRALVEGKTSPKTIIMTIAQLRQQLDTVKRKLCQIPDGNEMELANINGMIL